MGFLQDDVVQCGIPGKLISLLQQQDKSVKLLACRQLATYAASTGALQQAVASVETLQVKLTGVCTDCALHAACLQHCGCVGARHSVLYLLTRCATQHLAGNLECSGSLPCFRGSDFGSAVRSNSSQGSSAQEAAGQQGCCC
jgi:hypothetical protein